LLFSFQSHIGLIWTPINLDLVYNLCKQFQSHIGLIWTGWGWSTVAPTLWYFNPILVWFEPSVEAAGVLGGVTFQSHIGLIWTFSWDLTSSIEIISIPYWSDLNRTGCQPCTAYCTISIPYWSDLN